MIMNIEQLEKKIRDGKGSMADVYEIAGKTGEEMAEKIEKQLQEEFPNGQITEEDVRRIVSPFLRKNHEYIAELSAIVINAMYKANGIGLKAIIPHYNKFRENKIVREISDRSYQDEFY